jgi:hypothetical protein
MLTAMQDATGRIALLGRQAVDLATTAQRPQAADGRAPVADILDHAVRHAALSTPPALLVPDAVASTIVRSVSSDEIGAALGAVLQAISRDATGAPIGIVGTARGGEIELRIGPVTPSTDDVRTANPDNLRLERGGLGLSLVLASYVFDAIGARLTSIAPDGSAIAIALQKDGGLQ